VHIHNFPPGTGSWWIGTRESLRYKPHFFDIDPTVGVPSTFGFAIFIFQDPERYAYLSGTGKLKCIDRNFTKSGTWTCLVQRIKWKQEFRNLISEGIQEIYFTYRPVQIFKILFPEILLSESSAQDYVVRCLLLNPVVFLISNWQNLSGGNDFYWRCTSFEKAFRRGRPFNILHDS